MTRRPVLYVLAGVNGAGKSSIGGHLLTRAGLTWFNPDDFASDLVAATGCDQTRANAMAWQEGLRRLDEAISQRRNHAFETTLGGNTIPALTCAATATHDVLMWFCGLDSPGHHVERVRNRVAVGGHDIPEAVIRQRCPRALANLIALMPHLAQLKVYDNSTDVAPGKPIPDPLPVLDMQSGKLLWPNDVEALRKTPGWAKPVVEAALSAKPD